MLVQQVVHKGKRKQRCIHGNCKMNPEWVMNDYSLTATKMNANHCMNFLGGNILISYNYSSKLASSEKSIIYSMHIFVIPNLMLISFICCRNHLFLFWFSSQNETDLVSKYLSDNNIPAMVSVHFHFMSSNYLPGLLQTELRLLPRRLTTVASPQRIGVIYNNFFVLTKYEW